MTDIRKLPGPTGLHLLQTFAELLRGDLLKPFVSLFEKFGPLFRIPLPLGHNLVMLAHPDAVEQVLRSRQQNYRKGSVYDGARPLLGKGLVTSEGEFRRRQRTLANPAFRPAKLEQYPSTMGVQHRATLRTRDRLCCRRNVAPGPADTDQAGEARLIEILQVMIERRGCLPRARALSDQHVG